MKPTVTLINAFRNVANKLERNEIDYEWSSEFKCNCGVVAQEILQLEYDDWWDTLRVDQAFDYGTWTLKAENLICKETGLPLSYVFKVLTEAGLNNVDDFFELEYLGCKRNLYEDNTISYFTNKDNLIEYLRNKANELEKQLQGV